MEFPDWVEVKVLDATPWPLPESRLITGIT